MLIINHPQVRELLPMRDCMEVVGEALSTLARGEGVQPLRSGFLLPDRQGVLAWMPGSLAAGQPFGIKVLSVVDNPGELGVGSHQGGVMIFDPAGILNPGGGNPDHGLEETWLLPAVRAAAATNSILMPHTYFPVTPAEYTPEAWMKSITVQYDYHLRPVLEWGTTQKIS